MTFLRCSLHLARALTLLSALVAGRAHADDYEVVTRLMNDSKSSQALDAAQAHILANPRDPQMRFLLGVIQSKLNRANEALQTFLLLTQEFPELPEPYYNLAVIYASLGQFDKARETLEMAIRVNPEYATAFENLGDVYAKLAARAYSRSIELDPKHSDAAPKLARIRELLPATRVETQSP